MVSPGVTLLKSGTQVQSWNTLGSDKYQFELFCFKALQQGDKTGSDLRVLPSTSWPGIWMCTSVLIVQIEILLMFPGKTLRIVHLSGCGLFRVSHMEEVNIMCSENFQLLHSVV